MRPSLTACALPICAMVPPCAVFSHGSMMQRQMAAPIDEIGAATRLEEFRASNGDLLDISFDTISAAGPNGAICHYRVTEASNLKLESGSLFLIDSGAQYRDGTTDITRTLPVGDPSDEMKDRFTRVLKGMIAVSRARFPQGTTGAQLDSLARMPLWQAGLDYAHGTGHGVGSFLCVHEGPQRISKTGSVPLEAGNVLSNEPGYYKAGELGHSHRKSNHRHRARADQRWRAAAP